jgi:diguanylate cyclase (GGDEF)-like protein/PAS domain S-box-containing protein
MSDADNSSGAGASERRWLDDGQGGGVLSGEAGVALDRLAALAARLLHLPAALVTAVDDERQVLVSCVGLPEPWCSARGVPLSSACWRQVATSGRPLVVDDVREHRGFEDDPVVAELGAVACAAVPLTTTSGEVIGAFGVVDDRQRRWTSGDVAVLTDLAASAATEIALLEDIAERKRAEAGLRESEERFRLLVEGTTDYAIFMLDPEGRVASWNAGAEAIKGYREEEILGRHFSVFYPPEAHAIDHPQRELEIAEQTGRYTEEGWRLRQDGSRFWASVVITAIHDDHGRLRGFSKVTRDMTERKRAEDALRRQADLLDLAPNAVVVRDAASECLSHWSPGAQEMYGWRAEDALGQLPHELLRTEFPQSPGAVRDALEQTGRWEGELRHVARDGREVIVLSRQAVQRDADGRPRAILEVNTEITGHKRAERRLRDSEERFRSAFEHAPIGIALAQAHEPWRLVQANPALASVLGHPAEELVGAAALTLVEPGDVEEVREALGRLLAGEVERVTLEPRLVHAAGHAVWANLNASLARRGDGACGHVVLQVQDVSERKRYEGQLQHLADHDSLTGLFNRRRFEEELGRALALADRHDEPAALLAIDLDDFKAVNDAHGHAAGDELLVRVAGVLRERLRETDVIGRLGGDEFAVILPRSDERQAAGVAEALIGALAAACVGGEDERVRATASIGVSPIVPGAGATPDDLLVEADLAMYAAKEAGRNRVALADAAADRQHKLRARMRWAQRIQHALDTDAFVLLSQPILDLRHDVIDRHELLLRLPDDDGDLIPPGVFLPVAEHSGQVRDIDRWVVSRALEILHGLQCAGRADALEVNLSGATLGDARTMDAIFREVASADIDHSRLTIEVTETAAIVNIEQARRFAKRLATLGCQFALDDFGAGFGSFYYLKHLPFDCLKIDGDFIRELTTNPRDQLTVKAIVDIARGSGTKTIAEFVEDEETLRLLRELGIDYAQGYHVGRPQPLDRSSRFMRGALPTPQPSTLSPPRTD